jgi:UDP-4-amino-4,6-dideoxy-N-acetyl-beta-L-altrosamine transaminase
MIPYGRQDITDADVEAVLTVLRSDFLTQGPAVPQFERSVASLTGAKHAVAVNSATSALHAACAALGLGSGDHLWTVPNTFVASANCGRYCGAAIDFVDIDRDTWNLSVPALESKLGRAKREGQLPKVVVPVHFAGQPTQQEAIWTLAKQYGFKVLEDASHAVGGSRNGEPVGSCRWSDVTVLSFHPVKIITTGEGGMSLTNDPQIAERMAMFRSHGITRDANRFQVCEDSERGDNAVSGPAAWRYEQQMLGFNYRMTDIHAALGASQLHRLHHYVERRNELARRYDRELEGLPLQLPTVLAENRSAFHLYVVRLMRDASVTRRRAFDEMRRLGVGVNVHYTPVHLQPYYRALGFSPGEYPEAEAYGASAITLPLYPSMTDAAQTEVIEAVRKVVRRA